MECLVRRRELTLECPECGGRLRLLATMAHTPTIAAMLRNRGPDSTVRFAPLAVWNDPTRSLPRPPNGTMIAVGAASSAGRLSYHRRESVRAAQTCAQRDRVFHWLRASPAPLERNRHDCIRLH